MAFYHNLWRFLYSESFHMMCISNILYATPKMISICIEREREEDELINLLCQDILLLQLHKQFYRISHTFLVHLPLLFFSFQVKKFIKKKKNICRTNRKNLLSCFK